MEDSSGWGKHSVYVKTSTENYHQHYFGFHFFVLFGLAEDPVLYGRLVTTDALSIEFLINFMHSTGFYEAEIANLLGVSWTSSVPFQSLKSLTCEFSQRMRKVARSGIHHHPISLH
jgi:hypothetical protein